MPFTNLKAPLVNAGSPIVSLESFGMSTAQNDVSPTKVDLQFGEDSLPLAPAVHLAIYTTNGTGNPGTAPGPSAQMLVHYAFSDVNVATLAEAPTILQTRKTSITCVLPSTGLSTYEGQREYTSGRQEVTGRYLYVWVSHTGWAVGGQIDVSITATVLQ